MNFSYRIIFGLAICLITTNIAVSEVSEDFHILSRSEWGAKKPIKSMMPHTPASITIHHTATKQRPARSIKDKMRSLQNFSQSKAKLADGRWKQFWADVPYHFYISANGDIAEGRAVNFAGDTNTAYDPSGHISIVLEGNFNEEIPELRQISALIYLIVFLANQYKIDVDAIGGHRQYVQTACPGHNLHMMLDEIRVDVMNILKGMQRH